MSVELPYGTYGTVYLRVTDTDRTKGNGQTDSIDIYQIQVTSSGEAGDMPPSVVITEPASNLVVEEGELVVFSATTNDDEDGSLSGSVGWYHPVWMAIWVRALPCRLLPCRWVCIR